MGVLFLMFIVLPVVEMVVLIQVGTAIGLLNTIGLVLLTAIIGAALLRQQGLATLLKANQRLNSGELPAKEVAEGLILAVGGALLLTPGFVTDTFGLICLLPFTRHWLGATFGTGPGQSPFQKGPGGRNDIIEGEFEREGEKGASSAPESIEKK